MRPDPLGETIDDYRITRPLGEPGITRHYHAVHASTGAAAVVQILDADLARYPAALQRGLTEVARVARLRHPRIVPLLASGVLHDGQHGLVYAYVEGEALRAIYDRSAPLPPTRIAALMLDVLAALGAAHGAGVVHASLSPTKLLVTAEDQVLVRDFGLAGMVPGGHARTSLAAVIAPPPAYTAPEMARMAPLDGRADLYGVGVMLYEGLIGACPFVSESYFELLQLHLRAPPPSLRARRPELPTALDDVVARALAKAPTERFATAAAMATALRAAVA